MHKSIQPQTTREYAHNGRGYTPKPYVVTHYPIGDPATAYELRVWKSGHPIRWEIHHAGQLIADGDQPEKRSAHMAAVAAIEADFGTRYELKPPHTTPAPTVREQPEHAAAAMDDETGGQG